MPAGMHPYRKDRVADELRRRLTEFIGRSVKDPRVSSLWSITRVTMSPDLRRARVMISVMGSPEQQSNTVAALQHAAGFLRRGVGVDLGLRYTPELHFVLDHSIEDGDRILRLLREVDSDSDRS